MTVNTRNISNLDTVLVVEIPHQLPVSAISFPTIEAALSTYETDSWDDLDMDSKVASFRVFESRRDALEELDEIRQMPFSNRPHQWTGLISALEAFASPANLDEMLEWMKSGRCDRAGTESDRWDWTDLPTFGDEPDNTAGVWSWDATRVLIGTCREDIEIVDRAEFDDLESLDDPTNSKSEEAQALANMLAHWASQSNRDEKAFVDSIVRNHRTTQQNVGRVVFKLLVAWSDNLIHGNYDMRNEATLGFANDCVGENRDRCFPFI